MVPRLLIEILARKALIVRRRTRNRMHLAEGRIDGIPDNRLARIGHLMW